VAVFEMKAAIPGSINSPYGVSPVVQASGETVYGVTT
jgi:hypothetical protein